MTDLGLIACRNSMAFSYNTEILSNFAAWYADSRHRSILPKPPGIP